MPEEKREHNLSVHAVSSFSAGTSAFSLLRFRLVPAFFLFCFCFTQNNLVFYIVKTKVTPALTAEGPPVSGSLFKGMALSCVPVLSLSQKGQKGAVTGESFSMLLTSMLLRSACLT